jgi:hypothetical protein
MTEYEVRCLQCVGVEDGVERVSLRVDDDRTGRVSATNSDWPTPTSWGVGIYTISRGKHH